MNTLPHLAKKAMLLLCALTLTLGTVQAQTIDFASKILPEAGMAPNFCSSIAVDGETLVVGGGGEVYVYERQANGSYLKVAQLTGTEVDAETDFGFSLAIEGDVIVVGNPSANAGGISA